MNTILFDLDGTLLPMDMDMFTQTYFGLLAKKMAGYGYEPNKLIDMVWAGTKAMVKNDGQVSNEEVFWKFFEGAYGERVQRDRQIFEEFYANEFDGAKAVCGAYDGLAQLIREVREKGYRVVLATNPLFPDIATRKRVNWAGLSTEEFECYTTYENSCYCKPNPDYYRELLSRIKAQPEECLMVGNDVQEDMIAETLGMEVFLLTDHLINRSGTSIEGYRHGDFAVLATYLKSLPDISG